MPVEVAKKHNELMNFEICLAPEVLKASCSPKIIFSHAPQKARVLEEISENSHVLGLIGKKFSNAFNSPPHKLHELDPERISINHASTFKGYCDAHDAAIYRDIEVGDLDLTPKRKFLHCYRAVCREYYKLITKEKIAHAHYLAAKKHNQPKRRIQFAKAFWDGSQIGLQTLQKIKEKYDQIYIEESWDVNFLTLTKFFTGKANFVSLGCTMPHYDLHLNFINHDIAATPLHHLLCHATSKSVSGFALIYGWLREHDVTGSVFAKPLLETNNEIDHMMISLVLFENTFWRESWWNSINKLIKLEIMEKLALNAYTPEPPVDLYLPAYSSIDYCMQSVFQRNEP